MNFHPTQGYDYYIWFSVWRKEVVKGWEGFFFFITAYYKNTIRFSYPPHRSLIHSSCLTSVSPPPPPFFFIMKRFVFVSLRPCKSSMRVLFSKFFGFYNYGLMHRYLFYFLFSIANRFPLLLCFSCFQFFFQVFLS